jgi:hypothetical protein
MNHSMKTSRLIPKSLSFQSYGTRGMIRRHSVLPLLIVLVKLKRRGVPARLWSTLLMKHMHTNFQTSTTCRSRDQMGWRLMAATVCLRNPTQLGLFSTRGVYAVQILFWLTLHITSKIVVLWDLQKFYSSHVPKTAILARSKWSIPFNDLIWKPVILLQLKWHSPCSLKRRKK